MPLFLFKNSVYSPRTIQHPCHDRAKTERFLAEKDNRKITEKGTTGRSGEGAWILKKIVWKICYILPDETNQRNLGTALILTLCFMNVDFTTVFCSFQNLHICSYSCQLNSDPSSMHPSTYSFPSTNFPFEVSLPP